jgi:catechol 2,3-dioxygenase-like lactoylglutathione lyase family enzyme
MLEFERPGRPYPAHLSPFDNEFQHFAIVVSDMAAAFDRLRATTGWTAISTAGPQRLPDASGAVTAFKFRDPDGHPLEFLAFPAGRVPPAWRSAADQALFLGIDHSAVSVADAARSIAFYQRLGLRVTATSFNHGIEQQLLDGVDDPQVDVIGLAPAEPTPHVELLCYRNVARRHSDIQPNDLFASRLIFERDASGLASLEAEVLVDPDGHYLEI